MEALTIEIPIEPRSKKNSMQIIRIGGSPRLIPSKQYSLWRDNCCDHIWLNYPQFRELLIDEPINLKVTYFMGTRRKVDITNLHSAVSDMLVDAHIIKDDNRDICAAYDGSRVFYDKQNPRCIIEITPLEGYERWKN